jgi:hypothetical protein
MAEYRIFFFPPSNQTGLDRLLSGTQEAGAAMKYGKDLVPLAVMGSLSAAIMVVFVVTVMH